MSVAASACVSYVSYSSSYVSDISSCVSDISSYVSDISSCVSLALNNHTVSEMTNYHTKTRNDGLCVHRSSIL